MISEVAKKGFHLVPKLNLGTILFIGTLGVAA
jgi:hypothetical protein